MPNPSRVYSASTTITSNQTAASLPLSRSHHPSQIIQPNCNKPDHSSSSLCQSPQVLIQPSAIPQPKQTCPFIFNLTNPRSHHRTIPANHGSHPSPPHHLTMIQITIPIEATKPLLPSIFFSLGLLEKKKDKERELKRKKIKRRRCSDLHRAALAAVPKLPPHRASFTIAANQPR